MGPQPAIGRITPSGEITEFRLGLRAFSSPRSIIAGPDGSLWFSDYQTGSIGRITPSSAPANTFLVRPAGPAKKNGLTNLPVVVPGPGILQLEPIGLVLRKGRLKRLPGSQRITSNGTSCGRMILRLKPRGIAMARFLRTGGVKLKAKITFTPTGGSPYQRYATVTVKRHSR